MNIKDFIPETWHWFCVGVLLFYLAGFYMRWEEVYRKGKWHFIFGAVHLISAVMLWLVLAFADDYTWFFVPIAVGTCAAWLFFNAWCYYNPPCEDEPLLDDSVGRKSAQTFWFSGTVKWVSVLLVVLLVFAFGFSRYVNAVVIGYKNVISARKQSAQETKQVVKEAVSTAVESATEAVASATSSLSAGQASILKRVVGNEGLMKGIKGDVERGNVNSRQARKEAKNANINAKISAERSRFSSTITVTPLQSYMPVMPKVSPLPAATEKSKPSSGKGDKIKPFRKGKVSYQELQVFDTDTLEAWAKAIK